jgi:hypothetical protein
VVIGSLIASPLALLFLFVSSAQYVGPNGAIALVIVTFMFVLAAASASTVVAPLHAWDPKGIQKRENAWLTLARACFLILIAVATFTLGIIVAIRLMRLMLA